MSAQPPTDTILGLDEALDILEGITAGGLVGLGTYVVAGAVATLPAAFLTVPEVAPLSAIAGALAFVGVAVGKIRAHLAKK